MVLKLEVSEERRKHQYTRWNFQPRSVRAQASSNYFAEFEPSRGNNRDNPVILRWSFILFRMRASFLIASVALVALLAVTKAQFVPAIPYAWSSDITVHNIYGFPKLPGTRFSTQIKHTYLTVCTETSS